MGQKEWLCCVLTFVITLISCVLLACSFAILTPLQMGISIDYNIMSMDETTTWYSGRNFVGLGRYFIKFPVTYDMVQYATPGLGSDPDYGPVNCRSSDGLPVEVHASFSYILSRDPKDLVRLYRAVGDDTERPWHNFYLKFGLAAIRDVTANYKVEDFFPKREQIANDMEAAVQKALSKLYANVYKFELTNMHFPQDFLDSIEFTQVQYQDNEKALAERQVVIIQAEQNLAVVGKTAEILNATANTEASKILYQADAAAKALLLVTGAQTERMLKVKNQLNLTSTDELLDYMFISSVQGTAAGNMLVNMGIPLSAKGL
jgi:regulator of protease activity HflC (stomatin/prohibitin superfamily)